MLTITALLLTLGALLAAFGTAGFALNWQAPDHDSLVYVQALAATGRRCIYAGLLLAVHHEPPAALLFALAMLAAASYLTRTSNRIIPTTNPTS